MKTLRLALLLAALAAPAVRAQTVSPVPAPTIITTAPYTISAPGYYQLGANLTYAGNPNINGDAIITIASGNVTLDFAGHYISGPSNNPATAVYGVYVNEKGNVNIRNGTIAYCYGGVALYGNGSANTLNVNQRVDNMLITYCYTFGVVMDHTNYTRITNNRITNIGGGTNFANAAAVYSTAGSGNEVNSNTITAVNGGSGGVGYGIYNSGALSATGNTIYRVLATNTSVGGIYPPGYGIYNSVDNQNFSDADSIDDNNTIRFTYSGAIVHGSYRNNAAVVSVSYYSNGIDLGGNVHP